MSSNDTDEVADLKQQVHQLQRELSLSQSQDGILQPPRVRNESFSDLHHEPIRQDPSKPVSFVILGASGDLAKKKTYPALFGLFVNDLLPKNIHIVGYARSALTREELHEKLRPFLKKLKHDDKMEAFLAKCYYQHGQYTDVESFLSLNEYLKSLEKGKANRLFYLALPPSVFVNVSRSIQPAAMTRTGWNRIIIEKPFGRDLESAQQLGKDLGEIFDEHQMFRIDHYLGKEMVQNLLTLRFANLVFEPIWTRLRIKSVSITFKEPFGTEGRGGYFNKIGIVRDVAQNHLMQILTLVAMEAPSSLAPDDIRDAKVKVLRQIPEIKMEDVVLGQYGRSADGKEPSYLDDDTVPEGSTAATFASMVLYVNNERWAGVPFFIKCGKALDERKAEVRIQFRQPMNGLFKDTPNNELVLRVQPDEAVYMKMMVKKPGLSSEPVLAELDLTYKDRYRVERLPEAYEVLILEAIRGQHTQFVRNDELLEAWRIFTPMLKTIEDEKNPVQPIIYPYGSRGPPEADQLRKDRGFSFYDGYKWKQKESKL